MKRQVDDVEVMASDLKQRVDLYGSFELFAEEDEILRLASILDCTSPDEADMKRAYKECALQFHPDKLPTAITDNWTQLDREDFDDAFKKLQGYFDDVRRIWKAPRSPDTPEKVRPTAWKLTAWKKTRRTRRSHRAGWQVRQRHSKNSHWYTSCR